MPNDVGSDAIRALNVLRNQYCSSRDDPEEARYMFYLLLVDIANDCDAVSTRLSLQETASDQAQRTLKRIINALGVGDD